VADVTKSYMISLCTTKTFISRIFFLKNFGRNYVKHLLQEIPVTFLWKFFHL